MADPHSDDLAKRAPQRPPRPPAGAPQQQPSAAPAAVLTPEQAAQNEARRGRAALLRLYEVSTLTRANFCALKGLSEAALELQLEQARQERKLLAPAPAPERDRTPQTGSVRHLRSR